MIDRRLLLPLLPLPPLRSADLSGSGGFITRMLVA
jgi:hypothetical protein